MKKEALVIHSGGMDSSICLALAIKEFGPQNVSSLTFNYKQRHSTELTQAAYICSCWNVDHEVGDLENLGLFTNNALTNRELQIARSNEGILNTLVVGRNGLMAHLGGIYADHIGANYMYMGVMGLESANSGYRDCSREYIDLQEKILRIDLANPHFEIRTPLVDLDKTQSLELADQLGILDFLLKETITCYEGLRGRGCQVCPACKLRNEGIDRFYSKSI